jgi:hypothetical protein
LDSDKKLNKISDIIDGLPRLKVFDTELTTHEEKFPFKGEFPVVDKNTYLGIEVEVENVQTFQNISPYWRIIEDGSLRNNGREFITPPIRAWRVEQALTTLFEQQINKDVDFSERTSIHIHMNIRTLTVAQLEALVITYLLFERSMFNFVEKRRYNSVFCVPICETQMGKYLDRLILNGNPIFSWQKYTALNLLPITEKGTIEFRHMQGTKDIKKLMTWINLILCLKKFALRNDPEYIWHRVTTLNTTSEYRMFGEEVFGTLIEEIYTNNFNNEVEKCSIYIKNQCLTNFFKEDIKSTIHEKSPLFKHKVPQYMAGRSPRATLWGLQREETGQSPAINWDDLEEDIIVTTQTGTRQRIPNTNRTGNNLVPPPTIMSTTTQNLLNRLITNF